MLKKRKRALNGKPDTRSMAPKGPSRDKAHLDFIRSLSCAVCQRGGTQAHHVRSIGPRTMGKRVSDYLTIALCPTHHATLHSMNESDFWTSCRLSPARWIAAVSHDGAAAIAALNGAPANSTKGQGTLT